MTGKFYDGGIDAKAVRDTVFLQPSGKKIIKIENKTYSTSIKGHKFTVDYKPAAGLKKARNSFEYESGFDPDDASPYIVSSSELGAKYEPNSTSDAYTLTREMLDTEKAPALDEETVLDRYAWFVEICRRFSDDAMLEYVLEQAPKKKDGTLHKGRVTVIAGFPVIISDYLSFFVLAAKAKTDTSLEVSVLERYFSRDLWLETKNSTFIQYMTTGNAPEKEYSATLYWQVRYPDKKIKLDIPVIKLEDGSFAVNAYPLRPLHDFACLNGDDKKGYTITFAKAPGSMQISSLGQQLNVSFNLDPAYNGLYGFIDHFSDYLKYYKSRKNKDKERAEYFINGVSLEKDRRPIPDRALTEEYLCEAIYQFLTAADDTAAALKDRVFIQAVVDAAKRKKDGALSRFAFKNTVPVKSSIYRQVPLVYAAFETINRTGDSIEIQIDIIRDKEDMWTSGKRE